MALSRHAFSAVGLLWAALAVQPLLGPTEAHAAAADAASTTHMSDDAPPEENETESPPAIVTAIPVDSTTPKPSTPTPPSATPATKTVVRRAVLSGSLTGSTTPTEVLPCADADLTALAFTSDPLGVNVTLAHPILFIADAAEVEAVSAVGVCDVGNSQCAILLAFNVSSDTSATLRDVDTDLDVPVHPGGFGCSFTPCAGGVCGGALDPASANGILQTLAFTAQGDPEKQPAVVPTPDLAPFFLGPAGAGSAASGFLPRNRQATLSFAASIRATARRAIAVVAATATATAGDTPINATTRFAASDSSGARVTPGTPAAADIPFVQLGDGEGGVAGSAGVTYDGFPSCQGGGGAASPPHRIASADPASNIFAPQWAAGAAWGGPAPPAQNRHVACRLAFAESGGDPSGTADISLYVDAKRVASGSAAWATPTPTPHSTLSARGWGTPWAPSLRITTTSSSASDGDTTAAAAAVWDYTVSAGAQQIALQGAGVAGLPPDVDPFGVTPHWGSAVGAQVDCPYNPSGDAFGVAEGATAGDPFPFLRQHDEGAALASIVRDGGVGCPAGSFAPVTQQACTLAAMLLNLSVVYANPVTGPIPSDLLHLFSAGEPGSAAGASASAARSGLVGNQVQLHAAFSVNGKYMVPTGCRYRADPPLQGLWFFAQVVNGSESLPLRPTSTSEWLLCADAVVAGGAEEDDDNVFRNSPLLGVLIACLAGFCLVASYCRYERSRPASNFISDHFDPIFDDDLGEEGEALQHFVCNHPTCSDGSDGGPFRARTAERLQRHMQWRHVRKQLCPHGILPDCCEECGKAGGGGGAAQQQQQQQRRGSVPPGMGSRDMMSSGPLPSAPVSQVPHPLQAQASFSGGAYAGDNASLVSRRGVLEASPLSPVEACPTVDLS